MIPLFLFSGTFFPVSQLPALLQPLAYVTPLWHGVDLCRTLALGTATTAAGWRSTSPTWARSPRRASGPRAIAFRRRLVT